MLKCFISHCSDDLETIVEPLVEILSNHFLCEKFRFFCSSTADTALLPGTEVGIALKRELKESNCMISIVSDSYLRSPISLTELSSMWFTCEEKSIIPIV